MLLKHTLVIHAVTNIKIHCVGSFQVQVRIHYRHKFITQLLNFENAAKLGVVLHHFCGFIECLMLIMWCHCQFLILTLFGHQRTYILWV